MNLTQAVDFLGINSRTLRIAVEQGEIQAEHPVSAGSWIFRRSVLEANASARLVERVHRQRLTPAIPTADQTTLDFSTT